MNATSKNVLSIVSLVWQPGVFRTAINSRHDAQNRVWNAKKNSFILILIQQTFTLAKNGFHA